jgi:hypothetical protein
MSIHYSFEFDLNVDNCEEYIGKFFNLSYRKNCLFIDYASDSLVSWNEAIEIAKEKLLSNKDDGEPLTLHFLDTFLFIRLKKSINNKLKMIFFTSGGIWRKSFRNRGDIDLDASRYLLLTTDLLDGFDVVGMKFVIHY